MADGLPIIASFVWHEGSDRVSHCVLFCSNGDAPLSSQ